MYVGTIIEYDDQSAITTLPIADVRTQPLYLSLFTSDKGPEEWTVKSGNIPKIPKPTLIRHFLLR